MKNSIRNMLTVWNKLFFENFHKFERISANFAFTLAEMMVVMLTISIVLAAMAPIVSTKMKHDMEKEREIMSVSSIWKWNDDETGIYFGPGGKDAVVISQDRYGMLPNREALLVLNTSNESTELDSKHILFKYKDKSSNCLDFGECNDLVNGWIKLTDKLISIGYIPVKDGVSGIDYVDDNSVSAVLIGSITRYIDSSAYEDLQQPFNSVIIGTGIRHNVQNSVLIAPFYEGNISSPDIYSGNNQVVIAGYTKSGSGMAIKGKVTSSGTAIGGETDYGLAIAGKATGSGIAIGREAQSNQSSGISIGRGAYGTGTYGDGGIVIGKSKAKDNNKACIYQGYTLTCFDISSRGEILIGREASSISEKGSAIGYKTRAPGRYYIKNNTIMLDDYETITLSADGSFNEKGELVSTNSTVYIPGDLVVGKQAYIGDNLKNDEPLFLAAGQNMYTVKKSGSNLIYGSTISPKYSDYRLKYVGKENKDGLDKIRQLKVFNYTFKKDKTKEPHVGVIAQDLQKVFSNAVKKASDGFLTIRMEDMFYALINAVKKLDIRYQAQQRRINTLKTRINVLEKYITELEAEGE